ncbi:MAG: nuclear transport factor 2 family protein [Gammaproteobacteria bacterium]|nr:nuclear transport factor 2 family protein [Gammaproteobacteria bacterium]
MSASLTLEKLSPEQRDLWVRVCELWEQSRGRDRTLIGASIHPGYVGWDMSAEVPHNKAAAIAAVTDDAPELKDYALFPLSIQTYDHSVGIVHHTYRATVQPRGAAPLEVTGKWTEVYLRQGSAWMMIAVSGRPDSSPGAKTHAGAAA